FSVVWTGWCFLEAIAAAVDLARIRSDEIMCETSTFLKMFARFWASAFPVSSKGTFLLPLNAFCALRTVCPCRTTYTSTQSWSELAIIVHFLEFQVCRTWLRSSPRLTGHLKY